MRPPSRDPRPGPTGEADIRPVVARSGRSAPPWLIVSLAVLAAIALFVVLEGQRQARTAPATAVRVSDGVRMAAALPPLYIASEPMIAPPPPPPPPEAPAAPAAPVIYRPSPPPAAPAPAFVPTPATPSPGPAPVYLPQQPLNEPGASRGEVLVIDTTRSSLATGAAPAADGDAAAGRPGSSAVAVATAPVRSTRVRRGATTVAQGTLIPAVLETALDSTRPGHVRAMVTRDVTGADGSRVLIPRGTRLFGDYEADLKPGQNRAFVQWTQLVRPDGVSIAIDSPAADRLGRAGIQGRVDSHFLERFGTALLQSTMNLGFGWAGRSIGGDNPVIVALPGSAQGGGAAAGGQVQPTLRVEAGATVTVFVARDLDFPAVRW